jgi:hypothetical protein
VWNGTRSQYGGVLDLIIIEGGRALFSLHPKLKLSNIARNGGFDINQGWLANLISNMNRRLSREYSREAAISDLYPRSPTGITRMNLKYPPDCIAEQVQVARIFPYPIAHHVCWRLQRCPTPLPEPLKILLTMQHKKSLRFVRWLESYGN